MNLIEHFSKHICFTPKYTMSKKYNTILVFQDSRQYIGHKHYDKMLNTIKTTLKALSSLIN